MRWAMSGKYPSGTHAGGAGNAGNAAGAGVGGGFGPTRAGPLGAVGGGVGFEGGTGTAAGVTAVGAGGTAGATAGAGGGGTAVYQRKSLRSRRCAISMRRDCAGFTHGLVGNCRSRRRIVSTAAARSRAW